jgi:thioredoxin 1
MSVMNTNSICIVLTDADFQKEILESKQLVLVEFSANWSGLCQIIAPVIEDMALRFGAQVKFCAIDVDAGGDIANAYGIRKIPTILFFKEGQVVDSIAGAVPRARIAKKLEALLRLDQKDKSSQ